MRKERIFRFSGEAKERLVAVLVRLLAAEETVRFAYLYGSFLEDVPCRDIDIGVSLDGPSLVDMALCAVELGARLSREVGCPVDIRVLNEAPVSFSFQVLRGRLIFLRDPEVYGDFFERTVSRYLDIKPLLLRATKEAFGDA
ncbi:MAG: nucleotidyltransferase domain-containing protein [Thermodesulfobacteriota bacterium]